MCLGSLFQAAYALKVQRVKAIRHHSLIERKLFFVERLQSLKVVVTDAKNDNSTRATLSGLIKVFGEGDADLRDGTRRWAAGVVHERLLLLGDGQCLRLVRRNVEGEAITAHVATNWLLLMKWKLSGSDTGCSYPAKQQESDDDDGRKRGQAKESDEKREQLWIHERPRMVAALQESRDGTHLDGDRDVGVFVVRR